MKAVNLRPLALFCLSFFVLSIIVSAEYFWKIPVAIAAIILSIILFVVFFRFGRNLYFRSFALIALAFAAALLFSVHFIDKPLAEYAEYEGQHEISGKITDKQWTNSYSSGYIAEIYEIDGERVNLNVSLSASEILRRGDTFDAVAELSTVSGSENLSYYISCGIYLAADVKDVSYTGQSLDIGDRLYEINQRLSAHLVGLMGEQNGGFAASMFLGNRDYMKDDFTNAVTKLGLAHVIALSGMHLTVICAMLSLVLSNFGAKASRLCAIPIVMFYILLTGFFASIVRAGVMLICYNLISFTGRATDQPTNLGISALLIILFDPAAVCDIGFQLSVVAMLGVFATLKLMGGQSIEYDPPKKKIIKAALLPFMMGVVSMGFTMIPVIFYFGYITPAAIPATIPFSFMGDVILWLSPFALALGGVWIFGDMLCILCSIPCEAFIRLALLLGRSNKITVDVSEDPQIWLAVLFSVTFMMIFVLDTKRARRIFLAISIAFFVAFSGVSGYSGWRDYNSVCLSTVDIPSGDGFVVSCREDTVAVDISSGSQKLYRYLANEAVDMHIDEIDCLIIADPHAAHAYNLWVLTERVDIKEIWMPDDEASRYVGSMIEYKAEIVYYSHGDKIEAEKFSLVTYEDKYLERSKVPVVRFMVETDENRLFYAGSAATEAEIYPEDCEYLWIGGYGPKNKAQMEFDTTANEIFISEKSIDYCLPSPTDTTNKRIILQNP